MDEEAQAQAVADAFALLRSGSEQGVRQGCALLLKTMGKPIAAYFRRHRVHADEIDDLLQQVLLRVFERVPAGRMNRNAPPVKWLWRVVKSVMVTHFRRVRRQPQPIGDDLDALRQALPSMTEPPRWLTNDVSRALCDFEQENPSKAALIMRVVAGDSHRQIAKRLGCAQTSVGDRIYRARERLREYLDGRRARRD